MSTTINFIVNGQDIGPATVALPRGMRREDYTKANTFCCPVGAYAGRGYFLCTYGQAQRMEAAGKGIDVRMHSGKASSGNAHLLQLVDLRFVKATQVFGSVLRDQSLFMVELADKRIEWELMCKSVIELSEGEFRQGSFNADFTAPAIIDEIADFLNRDSFEVAMRGSLSKQLTAKCALYGMLIVYHPTTGVIEQKRLGEVQPATPPNLGQEPIYASRELSNPSYDIGDVVFQIPVIDKEHGFLSCYVDEVSTEDRTRTRLWYQKGESTGTWGRVMNAFSQDRSDSEFSIIKRTKSLPNGYTDYGYLSHFCIPFFSAAFFSFVGSPPSTNYTDSEFITNKTEIESDCLKIAQAYRKDSEIPHNRSTYDGFHDIQPGTYIKAVIWSANHGAKTEFIIHPGVPSTRFDGKPPKFSTWPQVMESCGLPSSILGHTRKHPPVDFIEVTSTLHGTHTQLAEAKLCYFNGIESMFGGGVAGSTTGLDTEQFTDDVIVFATKINESDSWEPPEPGFYMGRMIWSVDDTPVFAVSGMAGGAVLVRGTATEAWNGTDPISVTFSEAYGRTLTSPTINWHNTHQHVFAVGADIVAVAKLVDDEWEAVIISATETHFSCVAAQTVFDGGNAYDRSAYDSPNTPAPLGPD